MTEIKRVDDLLRAFAACVPERRRCASARRGRTASRARSALARAQSSASRRTCILRATRSDVGRLYAALRRRRAHVCERGNTRHLDRGARCVAAGRLDRRRRRRRRCRRRPLRLPRPGRRRRGRCRSARHGSADDPELRARFGAYGSEDVRSRYSIPRLVADLDALYTTLLERSRQPARRSLGGQAGLPRVLPRSDARTTARKRLRIVIVSQYFPPEIGATQSRMQSFAEYLADRGHRVTVICEFPNHPQGVVPEAYRGRLARGRPLERVPDSSRLGEDRSGEDPAQPDGLLPLVHGSRDRRRAARRAGRRRARDDPAALHGARRGSRSPG